MSDPSSHRDPRPPRWAVWLVGLIVPERYREEHLGDLHEGFLRRLSEPTAARRWYRWQAIRALPAALRLRYQGRHDRNDRATHMETLLQDLRYGLRSLRKSPGFAIVSVVTLALAIGVNTSIFSLVNVIVFADLPMRESATVAVVRGVNAEGDEWWGVSPADYADIVERSRSFERLAAVANGRWVLSGGEQPIRVDGLRFTVGLTEAWRLPPVLGRTFLPGEDVVGAEPVAMLTHGFWQDRYDGRPDVLGETIRLDGIEHTIVGVADAKLEFGDFRSARVVTPLVLDRDARGLASRELFVTGRLAPGVSQQMATEEVRGIGEELARAHPGDNEGWALHSAAAMDSLVSEDANRILLLLQLTVGMVILIACANVANMLLARATARAREMAVRSALGAGRLRLIRQLFTESVAISLTAAGLGLVVAHGLNRALVLISAGTEEVFLMAQLDGRVLVFTLLVSLLAPVAFGLFPALRASGAGPSAALRDGRGADGGRSGKRARGALVTAQMSLALTLMVVAGVLTRTVIELQSRPLGFDARGLLTASVTLPETGYGEPAARVAFFTEAVEALAGIPALDRIELTSAIPGADPGAGRSVVIEGADMPEGRALPFLTFHAVSPGYLDLIGLPVLSGRGLRSEDEAHAPGVALVSREAAGRYWPDADPIGRRLRVAERDEWLEVVGVVADVRQMEADERPAENVFVPYAQDATSSMYFVTRYTGDASPIAGPIREAIWSVDADQPVDAIRSMERAQYEAAATSYALLSLFITFAGCALAMSAIGVYGVMSYAVAQRMSEIGLRMALGAQVGEVRRMVVMQGARLLLTGVAIGLAMAFLVSRLLGSLVFGVSASDPATFVGVSVVLVAVAMIANVIPALRATRASPATTLRGE